METKKRVGYGRVSTEFQVEVKVLNIMKKDAEGIMPLPRIGK